MIYRIITGAYFILLTLSLHGQYGYIDLQQQDKSLDKYQFMEQMNVVLDKDYYLAGEKMRMAINTYDASFYLPVDISAIAYIELYTQDNQLVEQQKYKLENGRGSGYIQVPKSLQTDYYYIRAYTNYMKNYGPDYYYTQRIKVINPFYPVDYKKNNQESDTGYTFEIMPEGGKLIPGKTNKVVYLATSEQGYCYETVGRVVDNQDSVVVRSSTKEAVGTFSFTPDTGKKYRFEALVCDERISAELPVAQQNHHAILVDSLSGGKAYLQIITDTGPGEEMKLRIMNKGMVYTSNSFDAQNIFQEISLPSGINKMQLLTPDDKILATRYIAIKDPQDIDITMPNKKHTLQKREKQKIQVKTSDHTGNPVSARLNVSVTFAGHEGDQKEQPNHQHFKYISQLKRLFPAVPSKEFLPLVKDHALLNTFLITQLSDTSRVGDIEFTHSYPAETEKDIVTGTVTDQNTGDPAAGKAVIQTFIDSVTWLNVDVTDQEGKFLMKLDESYTGEEIFFVLRDTSGNYSIEMDNEFSSAFLQVEQEVYKPDPELRDEIRQRMVNLQVQDAYPGNAEKPGDKDRLRFYGYPDVSYQFDDYITLPTLEEFAFEIVAGAVIQRRNKEIHVYVVSEETNAIIGPDPLYLIDGVPVFDKNMVAQIPPEIMNTFEVVTNKYYYKTLSFDGIIDLTSRNGNFSDFPEPNNAYRSNFVPVQTRGVSMSDTSAFPEYLPQYLTTLYFNAELKTDASGSAEIEITAPDNTGRYSIYIHARNEKGESGFIQKPACIEIIE